MGNAEGTSETEAPSKPVAPAWGRAIVYLLLLLLAVAAIWWIDRGAMMTNVQ